MDYRKAWDKVKAKLEESLEEGRDRGFDEGSETYYSGMYDAYKRVFDHVTELESQIPDVIKVGDTVRVVNSGEVYSCYSDWIRANIENPFLAAKWAYCRRLENDAIGVVKVIAPHGTQERDLAYIDVGKVCFIIALDGLELIKEA